MSMPRRSVRIVATMGLVLCTSLTACDNTKNPDAPAAGAGAQAPATAAGKTAPAADPTPSGDKVKVVEGAPPSQDDRYALEFDTPEAKAGQESKVTVRVVPKEPWHMNLDYPTSLELTAPQTVALAKNTLKKGDAKTLDEKSCEFDVTFTPSAAGEATLAGQFKFAVCQDEACSPVTETVEVKVAVK